jgi:hypothetical protein
MHTYKKMDDDKQQNKVPLDNVPINSFPVALNVLYEYLNLASRRGAFGLTDSAKIMNCLDFISYNVRPIPMEQSEESSSEENTTKPTTEEPLKPNKEPSITSNVRKKT